MGRQTGSPTIRTTALAPSDSDFLQFLFGDKARDSRVEDGGIPKRGRAYAAERTLEEYPKDYLAEL